MKALLDSSFLLLPGEAGVDIFSMLREMGYEMYTIDIVLQELEGLTKAMGKRAKAARLALELLKSERIKIIETKAREADDEIFRLAVSQGFAVCTMDKALEKKIRKHGGKVIILRQRKYLEEI